MREAQEETTGRFARLENSVENIDKKVSEHIIEDRDARRETNQKLDRLGWQVAMIVGGITVAGVVFQLLAHGN